MTTTIKLQNILGANILKRIVLILISLVVLAAFTASPSPLAFIVAIPAMSMTGGIILKKFGGKKCIHCKSRIVSTVRPYRDSRTDICDTCQMWQSFMASEQERAYQDGVAGAQEPKAKPKARAEAQARARAEERARRQGEHTRTEQDSRTSKPERVFDPYEVLGLIRGASKQEIKTAYHKLMKVYHPDMVAHLGREVQEIAAQKALAINRAFEIIGD